MYNTDQLVKLLSLVEDHRDLIIESYSRANSIFKPDSESGHKGLIALVKLSALQDSSFDNLPEAEENIKNLSIEDLHHDLNLLNDLMPTEVQQFTHDEAWHFAIIAFDSFILKQGGIRQIAILRSIASIAESSEERRTNRLVEVFYHRLALFADEGTSVDRGSLLKIIRSKLERVKEFPLDAFSLVALRRAIKRLVSIDQRIMSLGRLEKIEEGHTTLKAEIRSSSAFLWNEFERHTDAVPAVRFLHETNKLCLVAESHEGEGLQKKIIEDQNTLFGSKSKHIRWNSISALLFIASCWLISIPDYVESWYQVATAEKNFALVVRAVSNPKLEQFISPGDIVTRVNQIVSPTLQEASAEIAKSSSSVNLAILSDGVSETISVNLIGDGAIRNPIGVSFFYISLQQKLLVISSFLFGFYIALNFFVFANQTIGVLQPSILYCSYLFWMFITLSFIGSGASLYIGSLGSLNFWSVFLLFIVIYVSWILINGRWIAIGWLNVFRYSWVEDKSN